MIKPDLNITFSVAQTPDTVFHAINDVAAWWTKAEGSAQRLNDVFTIHFGRTFITHQVVKLVKDQKVVWHVTDSSAKEWIDTRIDFEISEKGNETTIRFTHIDMFPGAEGYEECAKGWNKFIKESLAQLITEGKGVPA